MKLRKSSQNNYPDAATPNLYGSAEGPDITRPFLRDDSRTPILEDLGKRMSGSQDTSEALGEDAVRSELLANEARARTGQISPRRKERAGTNPRQFPQIR